jgi:hypothetical protein
MQNKNDRLENDQGAAGGTYDTGFFKNETLTDIVQWRYCGAFVKYWYGDKSICPESGNINNVYYRMWLAADNNIWDIGWNNTRIDPITNDANNKFTAIESSNKSKMYYNGLFGSDNYYLIEGLLNITSFSFTDNNIYEFYITVNTTGGGSNPGVISNRSFQSMVIPNVPWNIWSGADNTTDTDGDGLSDHIELNSTWGTGTNPFVADTDNDGYSDKSERDNSTDANNYTSYPIYTPPSGGKFENVSSTWWLCSNTSYKFVNTSASWWLLENTSYKFVNISANWWLLGNTSIKSINTSSIWFLCGNTSFKSINASASWWLCANTSSAAKIENCSSIWFLCGNTSYKFLNVSTSWWLLGNTSIKVINISSTWWLLGNASYKTFNISSSWWLCANASSAAKIENCSSTWWLMGNSSYKTVNISSTWWLSGNTSVKVVNVSSIWFLCGNTSIQNINISSMWWLCANASSPTKTENISSTWWLLGNTSYKFINASASWWLLGNTSVKTINISSTWWLCGNTSIKVINESASWWLCGNTTGKFENITSTWWLCKNESTYKYVNISTSWWICGNTSGKYENITNTWWLCENTSIAIIIISNIYPSNNSHMIPLQPVLYANINHSGSSMMNVSWYYGNSLDTCNNLLGTDTGFYNSTQSELDFNASKLSTDYYWRIQVDDGTNYVNETYYFKTEGYSGGYSYTPPSNSLWVLSLFGLIGIALWLISRKRKKKKEYY